VIVGEASTARLDIMVRGTAPSRRGLLPVSDPDEADASLAADKAATHLAANKNEISLKVRSPAKIGAPCPLNR